MILILAWRWLGLGLDFVLDFDGLLFVIVWLNEGHGGGGGSELLRQTGSCLFHSVLFSHVNWHLRRLYTSNLVVDHPRVAAALGGDVPHRSCPSLVRNTIRHAAK